MGRVNLLKLPIGTRLVLRNGNIAELVEAQEGRPGAELSCLTSEGTCDEWGRYYADNKESAYDVMYVVDFTDRVRACLKKYQYHHPLLRSWAR